MALKFIQAYLFGYYNTHTSEVGLEVGKVVRVKWGGGRTWQGILVDLPVPTCTYNTVLL